MANVLISPNMNLSIPVQLTDPGPDYANNLNASLLKVDGHNHTPGNGVAIPPNGLNINAALTFQNNPATNLSYAGFTAGASATAVLQAISTAPASGINELWWTDSNGVSTQITKNGVVNSTASSIPGESYASGTFTWKQGAGSNTPANFDIGSITLRPNTSLTTNGIQISPPSAISSFYNIVLPPLPASSTSFLTMDTSGNMISTAVFPLVGSSIASATITGSNIAPLTVARTNQVAVGQQVGAGQSSFSTFSTSPVTVTGLSVTITTSGRPVMLMLQSDGSAGSGVFYYFHTGSTCETGNIWFVRNGTQLAGQLPFIAFSPPSAAPTLCWPASAFQYLDIVGAGTYTYTVQVAVFSASDEIGMSNINLVAYEL